MKHLKRVLVTMLVIVALPCMVLSETIQLTPTDDMYTDPDHTGAHSVNELWVADYSPVSNFQRIMFKFDLSQLAGESITSATLHLYRFFGCPGGDPTNTKLYAISQDWSESTWSEMQHVPHENDHFAMHVFSNNGWQEIDLTTIAQEWAAGSRDNYGFVFCALPMNKFSKCYSKEASANMRPYLEIEYSSSTPNNPPEFVLTMPPSNAVECCVGEEESFMARGSDTDGDALTFTWKLDDQDILTESDVTESTLNHTFDTAGNYRILVELSDGEDQIEYYWDVTVQPNSVNDNGQLPESAELLSSYPNPFNPSCEISCKISTPGTVSLNVYDVLGQMVSTLQNGYLNAGEYKFSFQPDNLSSGVYFVKLQTSNNTLFHKTMLMR